MKFQDKLGKRLRNFYERLKGGSYELYTSTQQSIGLIPEISFGEMWEIYISQPAVRAAVDFRADQVVGAGFFTTMNEQYDEKRQGKTAKEFIDDFCEKVGLDQLLQASARNIVAFGNDFWWIRPKEADVVSIPLFKVQKISFSEGVPAFLQLSWDVSPRQIGMEEVVWIKTPPFDKNGYGTGILQTLCRSLKLGEDETRPSFSEIIGRIQNSIMKQFEKFGGPNELWIFPGINKSDLETYYHRIKNIPSSGSRFVTNVENAKVQLLVPERARGFDYYIETLMNEFYLGLSTPLPKLFTAPGFTEASANVAVKVDEKRVMALQRLLKRTVERELFTPILANAGFNPVKAKVRINWGIPEKPEYSVSDVLKAFEDGAISRIEARKLLKDMGWPLEEGLNPS